MVTIIAYEAGSFDGKGTVVKLFAVEGTDALRRWAIAAGLPSHWLHADHFDLWGKRTYILLRRDDVHLVPPAKGQAMHAAMRAVERNQGDSAARGV